MAIVSILVTVAGVVALIIGRTGIIGLPAFLQNPIVPIVMIVGGAIGFFVFRRPRD